MRPDVKHANQFAFDRLRHKLKQLIRGGAQLGHEMRKQQQFKTNKNIKNERRKKRSSRFKVGGKEERNSIEAGEGGGVECDYECLLACRVCRLNVNTYWASRHKTTLQLPFIPMIIPNKITHPPGRGRQACEQSPCTLLKKYGLLSGSSVNKCPFHCRGHMHKKRGIEHGA